MPRTPRTPTLDQVFVRIFVRISGWVNRILCPDAYQGKHNFSDFFTIFFRIVPRRFAFRAEFSSGVRTLVYKGTLGILRGPSPTRSVVSTVLILDEIIYRSAGYIFLSVIAW